MKKYILCLISFILLFGCITTNQSDSIVKKYFQDASSSKGLIVISFVEEYDVIKYEFLSSLTHPTPYHLKIQGIDNNFTLKKKVNRKHWDKTFSNHSHEDIIFHGKFQILELEKGEYELFINFDYNSDDHLYRSFSVEPGSVKYIGSFATIGRLPVLSLTETPVVPADRFEEDIIILKQKYKQFKNIEILKEEEEISKDIKMMMSQCDIPQHLISQTIKEGKNASKNNEKNSMQGAYDLGNGWRFEISNIERFNELPVEIPALSQTLKPLVIQPSHSFLSITINLENIKNESVIVFSKETIFLIDNNEEIFCMKGFLVKDKISPYRSDLLIHESAKSAEIHLVFDVPEESKNLKLKLLNYIPAINISF